MKRTKLYLKYYSYHILSKITGNKRTLKKKLLVGGLLAGLITTSACGSHKPIHKCYSPVLHDNEKSQVLEEPDTTQQTHSE